MHPGNIYILWMSSSFYSFFDAVKIPLNVEFQKSQPFLGIVIVLQYGLRLIEKPDDSLEMGDFFRKFRTFALREIDIALATFLIRPFIVRFHY